MGSHKYYPLHPTYYPNWVFTKILITLLPKLGHKVKLSPQKGPNSFTLWAKPKKPNKTLLQSPLLHGTPKARCYITPLKPIATQLPKTRCYIALLKARTRQYFYKISKSTNTILAHIYKAQIGPNTILAHIYKVQILFWQLLKMPKYYFNIYLQNQNIILATTHKAQ